MITTPFLEKVWSSIIFLMFFWADIMHILLISYYNLLSKRFSISWSETSEALEYLKKYFLEWIKTFNDNWLVIQNYLLWYLLGGTFFPLIFGFFVFFKNLRLSLSKYASKNFSRLSSKIDFFLITRPYSSITS